MKKFIWIFVILVLSVNRVDTIGQFESENAKRSIDDLNNLIIMHLDSSKDSLDIEFGGSFYSDDGRLNINLKYQNIEDKLSFISLLSFEDFYVNSEVNFVDAQYSFVEINHSKDRLVEYLLMDNPGVIEVYTSYKSNGLIITYDRNVDLDYIKSIVSRITDLRNIHYQEVELSNTDSITTNTVNIIGGSMLQFWSQPGSCSIGFNVYTKSPRKPGFVTAGHCANIGYEAQIGTNKVGIVTKHKVVNNIDAAFIELYSGHSLLYQFRWTNNSVVNYNAVLLSLPIEGYPVVISGQHTKSVRNLISNNASIFYGLGWTNMLKFQGGTIAGDSGGIVLTHDSVNNRYNAVGVIRGYDIFGNSYATPSVKILNDFDLGN